MTGCKAGHATAPDCICWHDEGTGPLASGNGAKSWREKPAATDDLIERLRNPMWVHSAGGFGSYASPQLDIKSSQEAMNEAAAEIERLRALTRPNREPQSK
jgi:hypothetical protein